MARDTIVITRDPDARYPFGVRIADRYDEGLTYGEMLEVLTIYLLEGRIAYLRTAEEWQEWKERFETKGDTSEPDSKETDS